MDRNTFIIDVLQKEINVSLSMTDDEILSEIIGRYAGTINLKTSGEMSLESLIDCGKDYIERSSYPSLITDEVIDKIEKEPRICFAYNFFRWVGRLYDFGETCSVEEDIENYFILILATVETSPEVRDAIRKSIFTVMDNMAIHG